LLLARAAAERAQLVHQIGLVTGGKQGARAVAARLLRSALSLRRNEWLGALIRLLRLVRRQPWIVPTFAAGVVRLRRAHVLRWLIVVGAIAGAAWWLRHRVRSAADRPERTGDGDEAAAADVASA
jgi:hypothetical protein